MSAAHTRGDAMSGHTATAAPAGVCCARIYGYHDSHPCGNPAKVEHEGKFYCGTHDPVRRAAADEKRRAKRTEAYNREAARRAALNPSSETAVLKARIEELADALRAVVALLTQPVQFSGTEGLGAVAILRGDAAAAVVIARAALAKAGT